MREEIEIVPTYINSPSQIQIFIAGDYKQAKEICRSFCDTGFCVGIQKMDYIYTGGEEKGVVINIISYPNVVLSFDSLWIKALDLTKQLIIGLHQGSATIYSDKRLRTLSRRDQDF